MQELRNVQISKIPFIPRVLGKIILHQGHLKICKDPFHLLLPKLKLQKNQTKFSYNSIFFKIFRSF